MALNTADEIRAEIYRQSLIKRAANCRALSNQLKGRDSAVLDRKRKTEALTMRGITKNYVNENEIREQNGNDSNNC